jgi:hypothetical protein
MRSAKRSLQVLDQLDPPELWSDAQRRPAPPFEEPRRDIGRRVAVILTAFALTAAATTYATSAFRTQPAPPPVAPAVPDTQAALPIPKSQLASAIEAGDGAVWAGVTSVETKSNRLLHIDQVSMQIHASIPMDVPTWRGLLVVTTDAVWTAHGDKIQRIDPATDQIVDTITLPGLEISAVAGDDGALWVAATDNRFDAGVLNVAVLVRIDPSTDAEVARIPMDGYVNGYSDQIRLGAGSVWVLGERLIRDNAEQGGVLARVDPTTDTVVETFDLSGFDMAVTDSAVWVRSVADGVFDSSADVWNLEKVDPATGAVRDPQPLDGWSILGATNESLWLTRTDVISGDIVIEQIDVASDEVIFRGRIPGGLGEGLTDSSFDVETRILWVSGVAGIERIPLSSIANELAEGAAASSYRFYPPFFLGTDGWATSDSGFVEEGSAAHGWASTQPFDPADLQPRSPAIPVETISSLPTGGIVIVAIATPWAHDPAAGAYPDGSLGGLTLAGGTQRPPEAEEPPGNYAVFDLSAENAYVNVRVFFGSADPTAVAIDRAQAELDTLQIPPVCPTLRGVEPLSMSATTGAPGDEVSLNVRFGFQFEDGTYDTQANGHVVAWWNADPATWEWLASFATKPPDPQGPGPLVRLGESAQAGACVATIHFTVPDASPGIYSIVVLDEDGNGSSLIGHADFRASD